jgi:phosphate transport system permease protein
MVFLVLLLGSIIRNGLPAFTQTMIEVPVVLAEETLDPSGARNPEDIAKVLTFAYSDMLIKAMRTTIERNGIETQLSDRELSDLYSASARNQLRQMVIADPNLIGQEVTVQVFGSSRVDGYSKGRVTRDTAADDIKISVEQLDLIDALRDAGAVERNFNWNFIFGTDASDVRPEQSGMGASMLGSLALMLVVLAVCLPISVAAAIYLEEFAPKNWLTNFIEINISNLAAVPSIVYGILALAVFIQFMGLPQSAPIVGGLALALMTLPTIIISTRASLKAVPPSIREAALGVGASKMQAVFHHVLPLAMPGILTGTIIGLAAALGETAPLLLIGMVGLIATDHPALGAELFTDPNAAMPAQIYVWAARSDPAWFERAWGGIIILLLFLVTMNTVAILLRRRFERRW